MSAARSAAARMRTQPGRESTAANVARNFGGYDLAAAMAAEGYDDDTVAAVRENSQPTTAGDSYRDLEGDDYDELEDGLRAHVEYAWEESLTEQEEQQIEELDAAALLQLTSRQASCDDAQRECPICIDAVQLGDSVYQATCEHVFHVKCLLPWVRRSSRCPSCRAHWKTPRTSRTEQP